MTQTPGMTSGKTRPKFVYYLTNFAVFLSAVLCAGQIEARVTINYDSRLEITGGQEGFVRPNAVTCDPNSGELVVTDSRQMGFRIFNRAGVEIFRSNPFSGLVGPLDASVDAQGRTVVLNRVDGLGHRLARLNLFGEPDAYAPELPFADYNPAHLIVTRDGHYVSLDVDNGFMVKNDSETGALIWTLNLADQTEGTSNAMHLGRPVEAPDGRIALPGGDLRRVVMISADGKVIVSFGRFGSAPGRLVFPVAAVFGPEGTLLVLDRMRHKILVFGPDYSFQNEFGTLGGGPGQFYHPIAMAAAGDDRIFVAQGYQGRVQVFNILAAEDH